MPELTNPASSGTVPFDGRVPSFIQYRASSIKHQVSTNLEPSAVTFES